MPRQKKLPLRVSYAMAVHDRKETARVVKVMEEHRTIIGRETKEFEDSVAKIFGRKYGIMVNSGSSANLLAVELMNLPGGSEVITPLLTFSTTVAPLVQKGLVPVFVDVVPGTYQINIDHIEKLITKKTKALFIPLLLGNVPDLAKLRKIATKHKLLFIEDSCDTLGATFDGKPSGTYSDISTTSFYGSHIITAGGSGGMILMNTDEWRDRAKVLRGWGRSSSFFSESEDIKVRFGRKIEGIDYDGKFIFDEIGYNFLPAEICSAFGNEQLKKLPKFRKRREENFAKLYKFFSKYEDFFILPQQDKKVRTQWLAFPLTIKKNAPFTRLEIMTYLEENNIQTRPIFSGDILKQPAFKNIAHRVEKNCPATNEIMQRGFLVGCHHGMLVKHLVRLQDVFTEFLSNYRKK